MNLSKHKLIIALANLQLEDIKDESEFHQRRQERFKKLALIIDGKHFPTDDKCTVLGIPFKAGETSQCKQQAVGIPNVWGTVLKNVHELTPMTD